MLLDEGSIIRMGDRWIATPTVSEVRVPSTVEALIRARLDTLPRPERSALQAGSHLLGGGIADPSTGAILQPRQKRQHYRQSDCEARPTEILPGRSHAQENEMTNSRNDAVASAL